MAVFEIQSSDGKTYQVDAPDMQSAVRALQGHTSPDPQRGFGQTIRDNLLGDDDPTTQNFGERVGTFLNKAGESATFGLIGDEASAAVESLAPGVSFDDRLQHHRDQEALFDQNNPGAALTADIGGGIAGAFGPLGAIGTVGRGAGIARQAVASAAAGAGMGATHGFLEGEGLEDRLGQARVGALLGGGVGAAAPAIGGVIQNVANNHAARRAIANSARGAPATEELAEQGRIAYQAIDDAGVQIKPEAFDRTSQQIRNNLRDRTGFDELPGPGSLTPNSARTMQIIDSAGERMAEDATAALPFRSLDQMRRQAGAAAGNVANRADQKAGVEIIEGLDSMVRNLGPDDVVAGDVRALQEALPKARDIWARMSRSQTIDDAIEAGQDYLSGASSGIRNQFRRILRSDKLSRGFSDAEKAAMRKVINGSLPERVLNLVGGGLGQLGQIGIGTALGGPLGFALGTGTAAASRKAAEAITGRNAETVRALIANGGLRELPQASDQVGRISEILARRIPNATAQ